MRIDETLRIEESLKEAIRNITDNTIRFHWSHDEYLAYLTAHVLNTRSYKRLPQWAREYLRGYRDALLHVLNRYLVFSYVINEEGTRATIESEEYRKVSPIVIHQQFSKTGAHVWRDAPNRFWYPNPEMWKDGNFHCVRCNTEISRETLEMSKTDIAREHIVNCKGLRPRQSANL